MSQVSAQTPGATPTAAWSFTDVTGKTVTADAVPTTIVAQTSVAAALYGFGVEIAGVYGPVKNPDGSATFELGNIDPDSVVSLGDWGETAVELDMEALVELDPDLIVDMYVDDENLWYLAGDARTNVDAIGIPTIGVPLSYSIIEAIEAFGQIAEALGIDLSSPKVTDAKAAHGEAETRFKEAIAGNPELKAMVIAPTPDSVYIVNPDMIPDWKYFAELGLQVVKGESEDFYTTISWEQIANYPADVILVDARSTALAEDDMPAVWQSLPAVKAGQIGKWYAGAPYDYEILAEIMNELAGLIEEADIVT